VRRHAIAILALLAGLLQAGGLRASDDLHREFATPPESARAWCYWWWLNGAASKEGITRDFTEMKRQGISGALLFDAGEAGPDAPRGPLFMSPAWREMYKHAVREADRLGITLTVNLCSGWNCGGPWVTPEHAAKKIVGASTTLKGPGKVSIKLPQPAAAGGYYRDIAVLACPVTEGESPAGESPAPKVTASSSYQKYSPALAMDGKDDTRWISNGDKPGMGPTRDKPEYLQFDYDKPWPAAGLYLKPYPDCGPKEIEIQCSEDGKAYRTIQRATIAAAKETVIAFDEIQAAHLRVAFLSSHAFQGKENWNVQVAEIAVLTRAEREKPIRTRNGIWESGRTVDLTKSVSDDGLLTWDVPAGAWRVMRIGCTLHGSTTQCVGSGPGGLEIDAMNASAMDAHFAETGAKLIADAGPLAGKSLQYFHIDSWELGQPTWTPAMREEFKKRRGYDLLKFLPALLDGTVDDSETTRRFLADYRRTAADLVAANYYGRLRELTIKGGLRGTHPESGGPFFGHWIDALQCEGINDIPMGEFWRRQSEPDGEISYWPPRNNPSVKQAACAAHIYGKPICQAEAFTDIHAGDWTATPWNMKDIGDQAFCHGLTRYVLCFWVHQPNLKDIPGYQWVNVGTHFDTNITWWNMGRAWLTYVARCQHMLRQGRFVADFAYFQGEEIPGFIAPRDLQQPLRPAGFDYDAMNAEVLLKRAAAKDGRLVLPDGMSYRYLVLPHHAGWTVSPAVLGKIAELAKGGVTIIGPPVRGPKGRPARAIGLTDYPECDKQVARLADELWGPQAAESGNRPCGAGRVIWGKTLDEIVKADAVAPDVEFRDAGSNAKFDWIHRRGDDCDIYFLSNQAAVPASVTAVFRVGGTSTANGAGKQPELWDAVTGQVRDLPEWSEKDGRSAVPLTFAARQSWFVVFRKRAGGGPSTALRAGSQKEAANFPRIKVAQQIAGPWEVSFDPNWGGPESVVFEKLDDWSKRPEPGVKYYSGTACYRKTFDLPETLRQGKRRVYLDLGLVTDLAAVRVNGKDLGVVWTAPWRVEITDAVKPAGNQLEIDVVNLWPNRLIGDAGLPPEKRRTVTNVTTYKKDSPLLESGLLGPVTLQQAE
jgi:hypothetical protein